MKLGLLADVRGCAGPLRTALRLLAAEGCEQVACLGSTAEGGPDDEAVLAALRDASALILPSPHDAADAVKSLPAEASVAGLSLTHAPPDSLAFDDVLWLTGWASPSVLLAGEMLASGPERLACASLYAPVALLRPEGGAPRRRVFLRKETLPLGGNRFLACPGSVAMAESARRGGCVMAWDSAREELTAIPFGPDGALPDPVPLLRILVYSPEFEPHRPDEADLAGVDLQVRGSADDVVADVAREHPDLVLMDYHLAGSLSGLEAVLALRGGREAMPVPVFSITGNPTDSEGLRSAGAAWGLPYTWLKDALTRLIREATGA